MIHRIILIVAIISFLYLLPYAMYPNFSIALFSVSFIYYFIHYSPMFDSKSNLAKFVFVNDVFFVGILGFVIKPLLKQSGQTGEVGGQGNN